MESTDMFLREHLQETILFTASPRLLSYGQLGFFFGDPDLSFGATQHARP